MQFRGSEVVRVANYDRQLGFDTPTSRHATWNGMHLESGYYFALWLMRERSRQCNARVRYFGPFQSRVAAQFLESSALGLGLLDPTASGGKVIPPRYAVRTEAAA
jgi:hypothetical protein